MEKQQVAAAVEKLKQQGVRITPQRYAILDYLIGSHRHPTADEIYQALAPQFAKLSVATIYNNLRFLTQHKIVKELSYGDHASRYDFVTTEHYHAICRQCGAIVDFFYPGLEDVEIASSRLTGYQLDEHRLEVYGLCPQCQKLKEESADENFTH